MDSEVVSLCCNIPGLDMDSEHATSYVSLKRSPRATAYMMVGTMGKPFDRERERNTDGNIRAAS